MKIVVDIGNTNALLGRLDKDKIIDQLRIETRELLEIKASDNLISIIQNFIKGGEIVVISGVVPVAEHHLTKIISGISKEIKIFNVSTDYLRRFIEFDLENPNEVGDDRIINAIAAKVKYSSPIIIVDFGTATTIDVVNYEGKYSGGMICPGVNLSIKSLSEGTAMLPLIKFKKSNELIGKNTIQAMESGIYWGYISMIEGLVRKLKRSKNLADANTLATGGLSRLFENDLECINYFDYDLTLRGLSIISESIE